MKLDVQLREDSRVGVYVENVTKREVTCVSDIITLLMQVNTFVLGFFSSCKYPMMTVCVHMPETYCRVLRIGKSL